MFYPNNLKGLFFVWVVVYLLAKGIAFVKLAVTVERQLAKIVDSFGLEIFG